MVTTWPNSTPPWASQSRRVARAAASGEGERQSAGTRGGYPTALTSPAAAPPITTR